MCLGPQEKAYTIDELRKHHSKESMWTSVHGSVYDLTGFAAAHPGGSVISLSAGRDSSILFESYHPKPVNAQLMRKLRIGRLDTGGKPAEQSYYSFSDESVEKDASGAPTGFYPVLRNRVAARLKELGLERRGSYEMWTKSALILTCFWASLYCMIVHGAFIAALSCGFWAAMVGVSIQHDGNHGSYSRNSTVNKVAGWTLDMIGASAFTWQVQHNLGHHPYTNLLSAEPGEVGNDLRAQQNDPDVFSSYPLMRFHPTNEVKPHHRFQHLYFTPLISLTTLAKVWMQDFEVFVNRRLFQLDADMIYGERSNRVRFLAMKALSTSYMLLLPMALHGWKAGLGCYLSAHMTCGVALSLMFIVNHVIEGVAFADSEGGGAPKTVEGVTPMVEMMKSSAKGPKAVPLNDWGAVQCQTSVNWASGSWFWNHFSGGLSHQIEHHLFPSICHTNYVYIQPVVQATCEEYGVPYQNVPTLWEAISLMYRHVWAMGQMAEPKKTA